MISLNTLPIPQLSSTMSGAISLNKIAPIEIGQMLDLLVANEHVIYIKTRDYYLSLARRESRRMHQRFGAHYERIANWIDEISDRACAIGVGADDAWPDLVQRVPFSPSDNLAFTVDLMLPELLGLHEEIIKLLHLYSRICEQRFQDRDTADMLMRIRKLHEENAWMLRAQL